MFVVAAAAFGLIAFCFKLLLLFILLLLLLASAVLLLPNNDDLFDINVLLVPFNGELIHASKKTKETPNENAFPKYKI